jgi:hypothetical protein
VKHTILLVRHSDRPGQPPDADQPTRSNPIGDEDGEDTVSSNQRGHDVAYGYMRVPCTVPDYKVRQMERRMRALVARFGLTVERIFAELACGSREAYGELLEALDAAPSRTVIVPTLHHLALSPVLHDQMLRELEGMDAGPDSGLGVLVLAEFADRRRIPSRLKRATIPSVRTLPRARRGDGASSPALLLAAAR